MKIAKIYLTDNLTISIDDNTLINGFPIDLKSPEPSIRQLISETSCIEIENIKYKYFLDPSKILFIKFLKTI